TGRDPAADSYALDDGRQERGGGARVGPRCRDPGPLSLHQVRARLRDHVAAAGDRHRRCRRAGPPSRSHPRRRGRRGRGDRPGECPMTVSPSWYLTLGAVLFTMGAVGLLIRRNVLVMVMCVELMVNAEKLAF